MNLSELCRSWQQRLGLQDWHVTIVPPQPFTLGRSERTATTTYEPATRYAQIAVLDEAHVDSEMIAPHDPEAALVHELLHLHFAPFAAPVHKAKGVAQEQAINAIAAALVALTRTSPPAPPVAQSWADKPVAHEVLPNLWQVAGTHRTWLLMRVDHGFIVCLYRPVSGVWTQEHTAAEFDTALGYARVQDKQLSAMERQGHV